MDEYWDVVLLGDSNAGVTKLTVEVRDLQQLSILSDIH